MTNWASSYKPRYDDFDFQDLKVEDLKDRKKNKMKTLLLSERFWGVVITSASVVLTDPSLPTTPWYIILGKFLGLVAGGATLIRTYDRGSDKALEGSKIQAGQSVEQSKEI